MNKLFFSFILSAMASQAVGAELCMNIKPEPLAGFSALDPTLYADLPDPDPMTAAFGLELTLVNRLVAGEISGLTKTYCQISVLQTVIDFSYPVEDDAFTDWITRAVFVWDSSDEPIGWRLEQLGERGRCARGDNPFAPLCP